MATLYAASLHLETPGINIYAFDMRPIAGADLSSPRERTWAFFNPNPVGKLIEEYHDPATHKALWILEKKNSLKAPSLPGIFSSFERDPRYNRTPICDFQQWVESLATALDNGKNPSSKTVLNDFTAKIFDFLSHSLFSENPQTQIPISLEQFRFMINAYIDQFIKNLFSPHFEYGPFTPTQFNLANAKDFIAVGQALQNLQVILHNHNIAYTQDALSSYFFCQLIEELCNLIQPDFAPPQMKSICYDLISDCYGGLALSYAHIAQGHHYPDDDMPLQGIKDIAAYYSMREFQNAVVARALGQVEAPSLAIVCIKEELRQFGRANPFLTRCETVNFALTREPEAPRRGTPSPRKFPVKPLSGVPAHMSDTERRDPSPTPAQYAAAHTAIMGSNETRSGLPALIVQRPRLEDAPSSANENPQVGNVPLSSPHERPRLEHAPSSPKERPTEAQTRSSAKEKRRAGNAPSSPKERPTVAQAPSSPKERLAEAQTRLSAKEKRREGFALQEKHSEKSVPDEGRASLGRSDEF